MKTNILNNENANAMTNRRTDEQTNRRIRFRKSIYLLLSFFLPALFIVVMINSCTDNNENITKESNEIQLQSRSSSICDIGYQSGCDTATITENITIDGCTFSVTYFRRICAGPSGVIISIGNLVVPMNLPNTSACNRLNTWRKLYLLGRPGDAENAWIDFKVRVTNVIEAAVIQDYVDDNPLLNFDCNSSSSTITLSLDFVERDCKKLCAYWDVDTWNLDEVICGTKCCLRRTYFCKDANGDIVPDGDPEPWNDPNGVNCVAVSHSCSNPVTGNCIESCQFLFE